MGNTIIGKGFISFLPEFRDDENLEERRNVLQTLVNGGFNITVSIYKYRNTKYTLYFQQEESIKKAINALNEVSQYLLEGRVTFVKTGDGCKVSKYSCQNGKEWVLKQQLVDGEEE